jgi:hypothetical protein
VEPHEDDGEHAPSDENPQDGEGKPELSETAAAAAFVRSGHARKLSEPAVSGPKPPGSSLAWARVRGFDLGTNPDDHAIDKAVDAVVEFASQTADAIVSALRVL